MARVIQKCCGWYYEWYDTKGTYHSRGPWLTEIEAEKAFQRARYEGLIK